MRLLKFGLGIVLLLLVAAIALLYGSPETIVQFTREQFRDAAHLSRKEVTLPNGLHYVYLEGSAGEPLLLLHGFGSNKDSFLRTAKYLTGKYQLIVPDHIGFAESAHPADADYSPTAQARRLHDFATALGLRQIHLGGSSMGGQIALTYAALYPSEVKSLWLTDPAGVWSAPKSDMLKITEDTGRNPMLVQSTEDFVKLIAFVMYKPSFIPSPMASVMARERIDNFKLESEIFPQILADSVEQRVAGLKTPTLIVWGENDRVLHIGSADILHKLLPQSRLITMPETGHSPIMERPEQSAQDYLKFRESLNDRR